MAARMCRRTPSGLAASCASCSRPQSSRKATSQAGFPFARSTTASLQIHRPHFFLVLMAGPKQARAMQKTHSFYECAPRTAVEKNGGAHEFKKVLLHAAGFTQAGAL